MPVLKDRRFRDMSLTEDEAEAMAGTWYCYVEDYERFVARAKRLLPLWRQWGLQELAIKEFAAGWDAHNESMTELDK